MALFKLNLDTIILLGGAGAIGYYLYINGYPPFGTNEFKLPEFLDFLNKKTDDDAEDQQAEGQNIPVVNTEGGAITYNPNLPVPQQPQPQQQIPYPQQMGSVEDEFYKQIYQQQQNNQGIIYPPYYDYNTTGPITSGDPYIGPPTNLGQTYYDQHGNFIPYPNYNPYQMFPNPTPTASITPSASSVERGKSVSIQCSGFLPGEVIGFWASPTTNPYLSIAGDNKNAGSDGSIRLDTLTFSSTAPIGSAIIHALGRTSRREATATIQVLAASNAVFLQTRLPNDVAEVIDPNRNKQDYLRYWNTLKHKKSSRSAIIYARNRIAGV